MEWVINIVFINEHTGKESSMRIALFDEKHARKIAKQLRLRIGEEGGVKDCGPIKITIAPVDNVLSMPRLMHGKNFGTVGMGKVFD